MSEPMKKRPTNTVARLNWHGNQYSVPVRVLEKYKMNVQDNETSSVDDVFGDLLEQFGEPAVILKGVRTREGLNQVEFAAKVGISQQNLSAMENGRRTIGKAMAKRIAAMFEIDYRLLL